MDTVTRLNAALEGRYRIERELGEGGMATVYLADDLKHERKVALKVLKPELAAVVGAERFLAEIKTTANLTHPNILGLHDSGEAEGFLFYVMPFVEGETLRDRLDREHQLPVDDAVRIASDVAEALEYAHRHGVIHRDIKPANILLQAGRPLIADFGIALAVSAGGGHRLTETGLSLGTPHYMSPEQATGDLNVGPATDIYALGCVLYEILVGEPPFTGSTPQAILGKIIASDLPSAISERPSIPTNVDAAIRRALEKVPADRFSKSEAFGVALHDPLFGVGARASAGLTESRRNPLNGALVLITITLVGALGWILSRPQPVALVGRFAEPFPRSESPLFGGPSQFDLSKDGTMFVYRPGPADAPYLMMRRWSDATGTPIRESERGSYPRISHDGLAVAFEQFGMVKVVPIEGGVARTLAAGSRPAWGEDGSLYLRADSGVVRVPESGGDVEYVSRLGPGDLTHTVQDVLHERGLALIDVDRLEGPTEIRVLDLSSGEMTFVVEGRLGKYLSGYLLYLAEPSTLMAARFNPIEAGSVGSPRAVSDSVRAFDVSSDGKLYYSTLASQNLDAVDMGTLDRIVEPVWVTRSGEVSPVESGWTIAFGNDNGTFRLSPDGREIAFRELGESGYDIWVKHLDRGVVTRLSRDAATDQRPVWGPGVREVTFMSNRAGNYDLWVRSASASDSAVIVFDYNRSVSRGEWSPGGEWFLFQPTGTFSALGRDLLGFHRPLAEVVTIVGGEPDVDETNVTFSSNGLFIAYESDETGRREVYVEPFPNAAGDRYRISLEGGSQARWSSTGREIFFQDASRRMMVAAVETDDDFTHAAPTVLFDPASDLLWCCSYLYYDVEPGGQRFLMARLVEAGGDDSAVNSWLVVNFFEELKRLVPN